MDLGSQGFGTGFLISPRVLITNNHVLPDPTVAARARAQFRYELDLADTELPPINYRLLPNELFHTRQDLDYTVVAVEAVSQENATPLSDFGCLPLVEATGKISEGEWLTVIQHPDGARKRICVRENWFIKRAENFIWYTTDTKPGSSGSPVFNNDWFVVALHHAGIPEEVNGVIQKNPDGSTKWVGNEGIRVSRIVQTLKEAHPSHPLLRPLYAVTPATARITTPRPPPPIVTPPKEARMSDVRTLSVPLEIKLQVRSDGGVAPVSVTAGGATESTTATGVVFIEKSKKPSATFDAPFDEDYSKRKGFDPDFLGTGALAVGLPVMGDAVEGAAEAIGRHVSRQLMVVPERPAQDLELLFLVPSPKLTVALGEPQEDRGGLGQTFRTILENGNFAHRIDARAPLRRPRMTPPPKSVQTGSKVWPQSVSISASL